MQPTRGLFVAERTDRPCPLLGLASNGEAEPRRLPDVLVRSYRTVSPLPVISLARDPSAVCSLLLPSSGHPDPALAGTLSCEAPTFLRFAVRRTRGHPTDSPSETSLKVVVHGTNEVHVPSRLANVPCRSTRNVDQQET